MNILTCWGNLISLVFDQFLYTVDNIEILAIVLESHITSSEISIWSERTVCAFSILPVSFEDAWFTNTKFSILTSRDLLVIWGKVYCG